MPLPESWRRWIAALRSGKFEQTKSILRENGNLRCCLGVACDLYTEDVPWVEWSLDGKFLGETNYLPFQVLNWLGLTAGQDGIFINLNDRENYTFEEIAFVLENSEEVIVNNESNN